MLWFIKLNKEAEPMREWLKELPAYERQAIGKDIKAVQFRWTLGLPLRVN